MMRGGGGGDRKMLRNWEGRKIERNGNEGLNDSRKQEKKRKSKKKKGKEEERKGSKWKKEQIEDIVNGNKQRRGKRKREGKREKKERE